MSSSQRASHTPSRSRSSHYDNEHPWLEAGEVNVGYNVFALHRGNGYATRAVELLMQYLALSTDTRTTTLLIDPQNGSSLEVARRTGFSRRGDVNGHRYFERPVRPAPAERATVTDQSDRF